MKEIIGHTKKETGHDIIDPKIEQRSPIENGEELVLISGKSALANIKSGKLKVEKD